jgi:hypothetical protein
LLAAPVVTLETELGPFFTTVAVYPFLTAPMIASMQLDGQQPAALEVVTSRSAW